MLQSATERCKVFLAHLLGPISGLVFLDLQNDLMDSSTLKSLVFMFFWCSNISSYENGKEM